jgi:hypothetical protein
MLKFNEIEDSMYCKKSRIFLEVYNYNISDIHDNRMLIHLSLSTRMWKSIFSVTQSIYLPLLLPSPLPLHLSLCQPDAGKYIAPEWSIEGPSKKSTESIVPEKSWYFFLSLHHSFSYLFAVLKVGKAFIDLSRPSINTLTS